MEMHRFTMEPFDSKETSGLYAGQTVRRTELRREKSENGMRSVYRQTALCALVVALLIVLELFVFAEEPESVPVSVPASDTSEPTASVESEGEGEADALGKLQFVSGRVYSVFSSDAPWSMPLSTLEIEVQKDGKLLCLHADAGTSVAAVAAGQVVEIGTDADYGTAVRIYHGKERESIVYGLHGVCVERGQTLLAGDAIGTIGAEGILYLAVTENGQPSTVLDRLQTEPMTVA